MLYVYYLIRDVQGFGKILMASKGWAWGQSKSNKGAGDPTRPQLGFING